MTSPGVPDSLAGLDDVFGADAGDPAWPVWVRPEVEAMWWTAEPPWWLRREEASE